MTGGRVAWNVVTSLNNSEAENFGHEEHLEHDLRYDRADEFMEVVTRPWDSWEDDALIVDKQTRPLRRSATRSIASTISGKYFKSQGPAHRAALGAGPSGAAAGGPERPRHGLRGQLGASWSSPPIRRSRSAARTTPTSRTRSAKAGRDPALFKIAPAVKVIVAETAAQAEEQRALTASMAKPIDSMALLCEVLNVDFAKWGYDQPFTDQELRLAVAGRACATR